MPMPQPGATETEQEFLSRFMGDDKMVQDYPDRMQRFAIAKSTWDRRDKSATEPQVPNV